MAGKRLISDDEIMASVNAYLRHDRSAARASEDLGVAASVIKGRVRAAQRRGLIEGGGSVEAAKRDHGEAPSWMPAFPDDDLPTEELISHAERRFLQRHEHQQALKWFSIPMPQEPIGLAAVGDPHLGSNGTNWPLLRRDVRLLSETPGMYALNLGDTADNWGYGRLLAQYANNDVSRKTERRFARWFLEESGIRWRVWLQGNHDTMDSAFSVYLQTIGARVVPMVDWRAQFRLTFPGGFEVRIDAAHDHKGRSIWNQLHGQMRASVTDEHADWFVAGHHHVWAVECHEAPSGRVVWLSRARGYKFLDSYALTRGFYENQYGATVTLIVDPSEESPMKRLRVIPDLEEACDYLAFRRRKAA